MFNILRLAPALNVSRPTPAEPEDHIFKTLRTSLTASSIMKVLALVALSSGVVYGATAYYLSYVTERSLLETMSLQYEALGLSLPNDLQNLEQPWLLVGQIEDAYDEEDTVEMVSLIDAKGRPLPGSELKNAAMSAFTLTDSSAVAAARENGADLRVEYLDNSLHVELYTRMLPKGAPASFVQLGHLLTEEDRIKHHLLLLLFAAGIITTTVSGSMSWWLTGRSLRSTKQLWEQQQTFVANASHELRTPLTLIRTTAQMLQLNLDQADVQRELLKDVLGETDYMTKLVDNMLVLARLDAGQLQLDLAPLDLSEVLPQVAHPFATLAKEQGVALRVAGAEGVVFADRTRFWQVLLILLDNSLRHTPAGGCILLESTACDDRVIITVTDTGRGILADDLPHVFERFYKANKSRGDKRSAGLGLSIAKPLVELQHGEIKILSIPGVRTIATIELPAYAVEAI